MVSNVPYPAVPTIGWRSLRQIAASIVLVAAIIGLIFLPRQFFFPAMLAYVLYGALKWLVLGLIGSRAEPDEIYFQLDPEEELAAAVPSPALRRTPSLGVQPMAVTESDGTVPGRRRRRRRRRGDGRRGERPTSHENEERTARSDRVDKAGRHTPSRSQRPQPRPEESTASPPPPKPPTTTPPKDTTE
jgi:hypothetical protein